MAGVEAPKYLDPKALYGLQEGEEVLYSLFSNATPVMDHEKAFPHEEIDQDPIVVELFTRAQAHADRINLSEHTVVDGMDMADEVDGYYRDVRVVPARSVVLGHRIKGWTLVGVRRDPSTIVYQDVSM